MLPTRVLVLNGPQAPEFITLLETGNVPGCYAALSYCWGAAQQLITTKQTLAERKSGIRVSDLPRTLSDAVVVARLLQIPYLWVDALCICQDDEFDWATESAHMARTYSNAAFTIAADTSGDTSQGFLKRPAQRRHVIFNYARTDAKQTRVTAYDVSIGKSVFTKEHLRFDAEPLTKRAWAMQERYLSNRLLHFAAEQVYFECNEETISEDGFHLQGRPITHSWGARLHEFTSFQIPEKIAALVGWKLLVQDCTARELTRTTDKLPALSGLAKIIEGQMRSKYVAGLWESALVDCLAWKKVERGDVAGSSTTRQPLGGPSWSWATYDGAVEWDDYNEEWEDTSRLLTYTIEHKSVNEYGEVSKGSLQLQCPMIRVHVLEEANHGFAGTEFLKLRLETQSESAKGGLVWYDLADESYDILLECLQPLQLFALVLSKKVTHPSIDTSENASFNGFEETSDTSVDDIEDTSNDDVEERLYKALIVTPVGSASSTFRRLGYMLAFSEDIADPAFVDNEANYLTVTLV